MLTYIYANWVEGKNVILHIFMYNVISDFSAATPASKGRVKCEKQISAVFFYIAMIAWFPLVSVANFITFQVLFPTFEIQDFLYYGQNSLMEKLSGHLSSNRAKVGTMHN